MRKYTNTSGPMVLVLTVVLGLAGVFSYGATKKLMSF